MNIINFSDLEHNLANTMNSVCDKHEPVIIKNKNRRAVMISLEDYQSLEETAYLLSSPNNAKRLINAITELKTI